MTVGFQNGVFKDPKQPGFLFYLDANTAQNLTGDGTSYQLGTDPLTQIYQVGSGMTTAGVFTASDTGLYVFQVSFWLANLDIGHTQGRGFINNDSILGNFNTFHCNPFTSSTTGQNQFVSSVITPMTAGKHVNFSFIVSGGTKTVGLGGGFGSGILTYVSGYLLTKTA